MIDLIGCISELILEVQQRSFLNKKRKIRAYEKEHNLPKKRMISPYTRVIILAVSSVLFMSFAFHFIHKSTSKNKDSEKIKLISTLLEKEKSVSGQYPEKLEGIIRNNPLYKNLTTNNWGAPFYYKKINNDRFLLISLGKDGVLHTKDDVK
ncbi:hypothetical protein ACQY1Q_05825 [Tenacibaculum sp. TC6]|uniref:hypothetical protein n=1 Tax=Tenacibaculum sp. TC6 TaxID=3423223 RepID=UPI003D35F01D